MCFIYDRQILQSFLEFKNMESVFIHREKYHFIAKKIDYLVYFSFLSTSFL